MVGKREYKRHRWCEESLLSLVSILPALKELVPTVASLKPMSARLQKQKDLRQRKKRQPRRNLQPRQSKPATAHAFNFPGCAKSSRSVWSRVLGRYRIFI